jgi:hypothetical protein
VPAQEAVRAPEVASHSLTHRQAGWFASPEKREIRSRAVADALGALIADFAHLRDRP